MINYNRFLLFLFCIGNIAVFIGASQKLYGKVNYFYAINAGLLINLFVFILFFYYNFIKIKQFISFLFLKSQKKRKENKLVLVKIIFFFTRIYSNY